MSAEKQISAYQGDGWCIGCAMFIDAVGYSKRVERAPERTRAQIAEHFTKLRQLIADHGGRVLDQAGDEIFSEYTTAHDALMVAVAFQSYVAAADADRPVSHRMRYRCGLSFGDILRDGERISGPKVNIAARIQSLAEPGTINMEADAHRELQNLPGLSFVDLGFRILKNISTPVRVWRLREDGETLGSPTEELAEAKPSGVSDGQTRPGLAVLPFDIRPADAEQSYFGAGLATDLSDALSRSSWLKVISARSSGNYGDEAYTDQQIGEELGVRYLVRGSIQIAGPRIRVSASLTETSGGAIVWSDRFDRTLDDIFELQDELTGLIAGMVEPEFLRHEAQRAASGKARNVDAWDLLMRSRWHFWRGSRRQILAALSCAEKAYQLDEYDSEILAQLSFCNMSVVWMGLAEDPVKQSQLALRYAQDAVKLDDQNSNAHFTLGSALSILGDMERAVASEKRALELSPSNAGARGELARLNAFLGNTDEARDAALRAIELSPADPHLSLWIRSLSLAAFVDGDYASAARFAAEAASKRPDWFFNYALLASCHALAGNMEAARQAMRDSAHLLSVYPWAALKAGHPFVDKADLERFTSGLSMAGWGSSSD
ncbi:MAG: tetratricopeptide repeat protein [Pseudomonadota bacterium]